MVGACGGLGAPDEGKGKREREREEAKVSRVV